MKISNFMHINQYTIETENKVYFQSYDSIIAKVENTENANLIIKDLQNKLHKGMTDKRFSVEGTHWMLSSAIYSAINLLRNLEEMKNIIEDSELERWKKEGRWRE